jgi:hypothetical protein
MELTHSTAEHPSAICHIEYPRHLFSRRFLVPTRGDRETCGRHVLVGGRNEAMRLLVVGGTNLKFDRRHPIHARFASLRSLPLPLPLLTTRLDAVLVTIHDNSQPQQS